MIRSMFAGLSGVICHQTRMDVIGNNLSNVNTVGFKESRTSFQDALYQTMESGSSPQEGGLGGTNPKQVGLGVSLASIDVIHTQGSLERTGQPLDLAIDGDGMFILSDGNGAMAASASTRGTTSYPQAPACTFRVGVLRTASLMPSVRRPTW